MLKLSDDSFLNKKIFSICPLILLNKRVIGLSKVVKCGINSNIGETIFSENVFSNFSLIFIWNCISEANVLGGIVIETESVWTLPPCSEIMWTWFGEIFAFLNFGSLLLGSVISSIAFINDSIVCSKLSCL